MVCREGKVLLGTLCFGVLQHRNASSDAATEAKDVCLQAHFTLSDGKIQTESDGKIVTDALFCDKLRLRVFKTPITD